MSDSEEDVSIERQVKVVLAGAPQVGKTAIANRYINNIFNKGPYQPSVGVEFYLKRLALGLERNISVQLWDIAGSSLSGRMTDKVLFKHISDHIYNYSNGTNDVYFGNISTIKNWSLQKRELELSDQITKMKKQQVSFSSVGIAKASKSQTPFSISNIIEEKEPRKNASKSTDIEIPTEETGVKRTMQDLQQSREIELQDDDSDKEENAKKKVKPNISPQRESQCNQSSPMTPNILYRKKETTKRKGKIQPRNNFDGNKNFIEFHKLDNSKETNVIENKQIVSSNNALIMYSCPLQCSSSTFSSLLSKTNQDSDVKTHNSFLWSGNAGIYQNCGKNYPLCSGTLLTPLESSRQLDNYPSDDNLNNQQDLTTINTRDIYDCMDETDWSKGNDLNRSPIKTQYNSNKPSCSFVIEENMDVDSSSNSIGEEKMEISEDSEDLVSKISKNESWSPKIDVEAEDMEENSESNNEDMESVEENSRQGMGTIRKTIEDSPSKEPRLRPRKYRC